MAGNDELRAFCTSTLFNGINDDNALPILVRYIKGARYVHVGGSCRRECTIVETTECTQNSCCFVPVGRKDMMILGMGCCCG